MIELIFGVLTLVSASILGDAGHPFLCLSGYFVGWYLIVSGFLDIRKKI